MLVTLCGQILVDKSWIFVNHLIVQDADTPIPQYRNTSADRNRTAVMLSRDPSAVVAPVIVHRSLDKRSCDTDHVTISSQVFALQTPALVHLKVTLVKVTTLTNIFSNLNTV